MDGTMVATTAQDGVFNATNFTLSMNEAMRKDHRLMMLPTAEPEGTWLETYPTTLFFVGLLHLVFVLQWNAKRTKKHLMVSYQQLIPQRQYFRGVTAILSHPPVDSSTSTHNTNSSRSSATVAVEMGHAVDTVRESSQHRIVDWMRPLLQGHLSGLPLLFYNAHILWTCRALEASLNNNNNNNKTSFFYCLVSWAALSFLMEVRWSYSMLEIVRASSSGWNRSVQPEYSTMPDAQRVLLHRSMGSCTALCASVLWVYHHHFTHVSLEPIPGVPLSKLLSPSIAYSMCVCILTALSWRIHPMTPVLCGTITGLLWSVGLVQFLGQVYWGRILCCWICGFCLVSLKHQWDIPCIDYVSWDARGRLVREEGENDEDSNETTFGDFYQGHDDDGLDDNSIVRDLEDPGAERRNSGPSTDEDSSESISLLNRGTTARSRRLSRSSTGR